MYKSITQYEGKPRDFARQVFGTTLCDNRSVIFGGRIENLDQIRRNNCETIVN